MRRKTTQSVLSQPGTFQQSLVSVRLWIYLKLSSLRFTIWPFLNSIIPKDIQQRRPHVTPKFIIRASQSWQNLTVTQPFVINRKEFEQEIKLNHGSSLCSKERVYIKHQQPCSLQRALYVFNIYTCVIYHNCSIKNVRKMCTSSVWESSSNKSKWC